MSHRDTHLNLADSSRQLFELDSGAEIEAGDSRLFGAGSSTHPAISNAAFRLDDDLDPAELIEAAQAFFGDRGRGFALWARAGVPEDRDLLEAAEQAGLQQIHEMPEMVLYEPPPERPLPEGVELGRVESAADAEDFWRVAAAAYTSNGFPPEVFAHYDKHEGFAAANAAAFLARLGGRPAAIAMTLVSHGVAGIYWVGVLEEARGRGLAWAVTAAAVNAGLDLGGELASLQASAMGKPVYERMGFESIYDYRLLLGRLIAPHTIAA
jgi:ribosomal protein S18 acetylase RimI-like enzyme